MIGGINLILLQRKIVKEKKKKREKEDHLDKQNHSLYQRTGQRKVLLSKG